MGGKTAKLILLILPLITQPLVDLKFYEGGRKWYQAMKT
jgi:hypothetical protein